MGHTRSDRGAGSRAVGNNRAAQNEALLQSPPPPDPQEIVLMKPRSWIRHPLPGRVLHRTDGAARTHQNPDQAVARIEASINR